MTKTRLVFSGISEVVGSNGMAIVLLSDESKHRMLSVVCDAIMKYQIGLRRTTNRLQEKLLPEVLVNMLRDNADTGRYEINVYNLADGEYKTVVNDTVGLKEYPIRLSDAILLSQICNIDLFMEESLFILQSMPYNGVTDRLAIPINILDTDKLTEELNKAILNEDYRLASQIKEELKKRSGCDTNVE